MNPDRPREARSLLHRYRFRLLFLAVCLIPIWFFFEDSFTSRDSLTGKDANRAFQELLNSDTNAGILRFEFVELVVKERGKPARTYGGSELQRRLEIIATTPIPKSAGLAGKTRRKICRFAVREAQGRVLEAIVYDFGDGTPVWVKFPACGIRLLFERTFLDALRDP